MTNSFFCRIVFALLCLLTTGSYSRAQQGWEQIATFDSISVDQFEVYSDTLYLRTTNNSYVHYPDKSSSAFLMSPDGGRHWESMKTPWDWRLTADGRNATQYLWGKFPNSAMLWSWSVFGGDSAFCDLSMDGGRTWQSHPARRPIFDTIHAFELRQFTISPFNENVWYLVVDYSGQPSVYPSQVLWRSQNRGYSWVDISPMGGASLGMGLDLRDSTIIYVTASGPPNPWNTIWCRTTNYGQTWTYVNAGEAHCCASYSGITMAGTLRDLVDSAYDESTDGGATWQRTTWHIDTTIWPVGTQYSIYSYLPWPQDPLQAVIQVNAIKMKGKDTIEFYYGWIYSTTDDGVTWNRLWGPSENGIWDRAWGKTEVDHKTGKAFFMDFDSVYPTPFLWLPVRQRLWSREIWHPTSVHQDFAGLSLSTELGAVFPNPISDFAIISYRLAHSGDTRLDVIDLLGRVVKTVNAGMQSAGAHMASWVPESSLQSGTYFVRLRTTDKEQIFPISLTR